MTGSETLHLVLFHSSNIGVESVEKRPDRVKQMFSDTCLRRDSAPESRTNSNIAQALGGKGFLEKHD